jgi:alcohol dehydrogenase (NADP+)
MSSGWGPVDYPQVVGHEIVGEVVRVGSAVKDIKVSFRPEVGRLTIRKVGDIVGVGAQNDSCLECSECTSGTLIRHDESDSNR